MNRIEQVEGTLSTKGGDIFSVALNLTVAELRGGIEIEDQAVAHVELEASVPDGEYTLDYFFGKPLHRQVRVGFGVIVAA